MVRSGPLLGLLLAVSAHGLPGSAPYIWRTCGGSVEMSISSGVLDCIRKAISKELMRVAISGSPT